jgi:hypothetical protein
MKMNKKQQKYLINTIADALDVTAVLTGGTVNINKAKTKNEALADLIDDLRTLLFEINNAEITDCKGELWF